MQLDAVPGEPGLPVLEVEEGNPDDAGLGAHPRSSACCGHLLAPLGGGSRGTQRGRGFGDHRARAASQDEVVVEIILEPDESHAVTVLCPACAAREFD
jgi:hypothetical protein